MPTAMHAGPFHSPVLHHSPPTRFPGAAGQPVQLARNVMSGAYRWQALSRRPQRSHWSILVIRCQAYHFSGLRLVYLLGVLKVVGVHWCAILAIGMAQVQATIGPPPNLDARLANQPLK